MAIQADATYSGAHDATRNTRRFHVSRKRMSYGVHDTCAYEYVYSRGTEKRVIIIGWRGS